MTAISPPPCRISDYLPLVDTCAKHLSRYTNDLLSRDDMASIGKIALVECLQGMPGDKPDREVRALCYVRVRGAILDELRRGDPIPRNQRVAVRAVRAAVERLEKRLGREPSLIEIAVETELSNKEVRQALNTIEVEDIGRRGSWDKVADENAAPPSLSAEALEIRGLLISALERLPTAEGKVLKAYYLDDMTQAEVAATLGVSASAVHHIRERAIAKLRKDFISLGLWNAVIARAA